MTKNTQDFLTHTKGPNDKVLLSHKPGHLQGTLRGLRKQQSPEIELHPRATGTIWTRRQQALAQMRNGWNHNSLTRALLHHTCVCHCPRQESGLTQLLPWLPFHLSPVLFQRQSSRQSLLCPIHHYLCYLDRVPS